MNSESPSQRDSALRLDQCIENLRFVQTTELVRSGKYLEAEAMLSPKGQVPETARELDLLARINAHQERFEDAARYWQAALKKDPGNSNYKNCLEQLSDIQAGKGLSDGERSTALRVGIGACVILLIIGLMYWSHRTSNGQAFKGTLIEDTTGQPATNPQSATVASPAITITDAVSNNRRFEQTMEQMQQIQKDQIQVLAGQITAIQNSQAVLLDEQSAARTELQGLGESIAELKKQQAETQRATDLTRSDLANLPIVRAFTTPTPGVVPARLPNPADFNPGTPGVAVTNQNNNWIISFNPGLFDRDEHFKIGAKARLASVAKALVQTQSKFTIRVVGFAEDETPTWPWSSPKTYEKLGFLRARSVLLYLRDLGIFPPDKLSAVNGTSTQRPFSTPNINNRSVTLEVSPD